MIQSLNSKLDPVSALGDPENLFIGYIERDEFPHFLGLFLDELIHCLLTARMLPEQKYSRLYMQKQAAYSQNWHKECEKAVNQYEFTLHWSAYEQPAEELLAQHAIRIAKDPKAPKETLVLSKDGDLAPTLDILRRWEGLSQKGTVCSLGWRTRYSQYLRISGNGTIFLEDLLPNTFNALVKALLERSDNPLAT